MQVNRVIKTPIGVEVESSAKEDDRSTYIALAPGASRGAEPTTGEAELLREIDEAMAPDALPPPRIALWHLVQRCRASIAALARERESLKLQAQSHAMEARTANATIAECYQLCTGATGEPGNWNGAEPVRKIVAENAGLRADQESMLADLSALLLALGMGDHARPESPHTVMQSAIANVASLRAKLDERDADAERYRWLRKGCGELHITRGPSWDRGHYYDEQADALIDAARQAASQPSNPNV